MDLPRSRHVSPRVDWRDSSPSTNAELRSEVTANPAAWPHLSCLVTNDQTAGRGRLDRQWVAPPGTALAASVLVIPSSLSPAQSTDDWGWIPLAAGVAMVTALRRVVSPAEEVRLKWPNDVLIRGRKVCGILAEVVGASVIVGTGVNLTMTLEELPTPTATSLFLEGAESDLDLVLATYLGDFARVLETWRRSPGLEVSGLLDEIRALCSTLGEPVRVDLPDGSVAEGLACDIDDLGRLVIETSRNRPQLVVAAGDVTHVRVNKDHDSSSGNGAHHPS